MYRILALLVAIGMLFAVSASADVAWNLISGPISDPPDYIDHVGTDGTSLYVVFNNPMEMQNGGQQLWKYAFSSGDPLHGTWTRLATPPRTVCSSTPASSSDLAYQSGYLYTSAVAKPSGITLLRYKIATNSWKSG
jgi:hypothetical protein